MPRLPPSHGGGGGSEPGPGQAPRADDFIELRARNAELGLLEGGAGKTGAWILGKGPAPAVIRAKQGQELKLRFFNELDNEIWLHFFGLRGPSELMTINVPPGDKGVDCVFTPPDAGTFWIGPVSEVSRHRDMGLYAMLVVEEKDDAEDILQEEKIRVVEAKLERSVRDNNKKS